MHTTGQSRQLYRPIGPRGNIHVSDGGVALTGEQDIMGNPWTGYCTRKGEKLTRAGTEWNDGDFTGAFWSDDLWSGLSWE